MAAGDHSAAGELLDAARQGWARLDLPFEAARTRVQIARLVAGSQPEVAVDHARGAWATFDKLGAELDADRTAELLRSLGVASIGPKGLKLLSGREQQVLRLLGAGLSNPEIAVRLYISRKTAAHHVSSVLAKLNLRNRAEAAAYAASASQPGRDVE
jgi:DNA-binding NarL/FixJ family response regulator